MIKFRNKEVSDYSKLYIIKVIAANHNDDLDLTIKMIKSAVLLE